MKSTGLLHQECVGYLSPPRGQTGAFKKNNPPSCVFIGSTIPPRQHLRAENRTALANDITYANPFQIFPGKSEFRGRTFRA